MNLLIIMTIVVANACFGQATLSQLLEPKKEHARRDYCPSHSTTAIPTTTTTTTRPTTTTTRPTTTTNRSTTTHSPCIEPDPTLPSCAVTPDTYNRVFLGILQIRYFASSTRWLDQSCTYYKQGALDANNNTAPYFWTMNLSRYIEYTGTYVLTMNGLISLADTEDESIFEVTNYLTGTINSDSVVILKYCNETAYFIGCNVDNCGSGVQEKVTNFAENFANSNDFTLYTLNFTDCSNVPS